MREDWGVAKIQVEQQALLELPVFVEQQALLELPVFVEQQALLELPVFVEQQALLELPVFVEQREEEKGTLEQTRQKGTIMIEGDHSIRILLVFRVMLHKKQQC